MQYESKYGFVVVGCGVVLLLPITSSAKTNSTAYRKREYYRYIMSSHHSQHHRSGSNTSCAPFLFSYEY